MKEHISVLLSYLVCNKFLQQSQKSNTAMKIILDFKKES